LVSRDEGDGPLSPEGAVLKGRQVQGRAARILVEGIVQGVGFRPFVHRLAKSLNLNGWVLNSTRGVEIEVEGAEAAIMDFYNEVSAQTPAAASILKKTIEFHPPVGYASFVIRESAEEDLRTALISPDIAVCPDCLNEMLDASNRRHLYPFINCTNCGPRYTIIESLPYDRPRTSMRKFVMCPECQREYDDISNRRYHAQPNACHLCGPAVELVSRFGKPVPSQDPLLMASGLLRSGHILAVKGVGGFHLACDAEDEEAVRRLRLGKKREMKPLAVMSPDSRTVMEFCGLSLAERVALEGPKRPIVLLKKARRCFIAESVAPANDSLGVFLPYAPLHYLLLRPPLRAVVMTSGNISDEPIAMNNDEALKALSGIADYFVLHNRDIVSRCDDSVVRFIGGRECILRRSRGYVPYPVELNLDLREGLACGGELKNTFCLTKGKKALLSQHIGDLRALATFHFYKSAIAHCERLFSITPQTIAHDLHPEYMSTQYALGRKGMPVGVQHHHAHIASCMAENGMEAAAIGVALDGAGYGADGRTWGCEFLLAGLTGYERLGHLKYVPLPGGDAAALEPYRMAISYLCQTYGEGFESQARRVGGRWGRDNIELLGAMIRKEVNSPLASSAGRLFDAASALMGVCDISTYEGQAAMELEALSRSDLADSYPIEAEVDGKGTFIIDPAETIRHLVEGVERGDPKPILGGLFHNTMAQIILEGCRLSRRLTGVKDVALSGGVFQNKILMEKALELLEGNGFVCHLHRLVPPNDGGISLGQAVVAASKARKG
jgi:hydrogenase maturation protein HypF